MRVELSSALLFSAGVGTLCVGIFCSNYRVIVLPSGCALTTFAATVLVCKQVQERKEKEPLANLCWLQALLPLLEMGDHQALMKAHQSPTIRAFAEKKPLGELVSLLRKDPAFKPDAGGDFGVTFQSAYLFAHQFYSALISQEEIWVMPVNERAFHTSRFILSFDSSLQPAQFVAGKLWDNAMEEGGYTSFVTLNKCSGSESEPRRYRLEGYIDFVNGNHFVFRKRDPSNENSHYVCSSGQWTTVNEPFYNDASSMKVALFSAV